MYYDKGSEWRKWDLHIHSPSTVLNNQFVGTGIEDKWEKYVTEIEKLEDISALGITDYFSIEGYKKMMKFKESGRLQNIDLLLPNVELRLLTATGKNKAINYHVIFSSEIANDLEHLFFQNLKFKYSGEEYPCTREGLIRLGRQYDGLENAVEDVAYRNGVEQFKVTVDDIVGVLKRNDRLFKESITVVANSSNDGASGLQHEDAFKSVRNNIYMHSNMVFSATPGDVTYFTGEKTSIDELEKNCGGVKPCIHGSDAHSLEDICKPDKNRYTWIKADPTFLGLKQVMYEPEDRVYIGEIPPLLKKVNDEPENYLESIQICHEEGYESELGTWFNDLEIKFNSGLTAIIGNKGKGKSAIADIIGLLGNSKNYDDFSFLNDRKFKKEKGKLAKNFKATLNRNNISSIEKNLNDNKDEHGVDIVKYIPQAFFEQVTNDLDESFENEIKSVIFSHIANNDKIFDSFDDLVNKKTEIIKENIEEILIDIKFINKEIIELELKRDQSYKKTIENKLKGKQEILNSLKEPEKIDPPMESNSDKEKKSNLDDLNSRLDQVISLIDIKDKEKKDLKTKELKLNTFKDRLNNLANQINKFIEDNIELCESEDLDMKEIINSNIEVYSVTKKLEDINTKIITIENELLECKETHLTIDEIDKNQLRFLEKAITYEIENITNGLKEPHRIYQEYIKSHDSWQSKVKNIVGDASTLDTIEYYKGQLAYITDKLSDDIRKVRDKRSEKCELIFEEKQKEIEIYNQIKQAIDSFIKSNSDELCEFKISLESGYKLEQSFYDDFINYIDGTKKGSFRGNNKELLKEIFEGEITKFEDINAKLKKVIEFLECDYRDEDTKEEREITGQIKKGKINEFYNYIYSIDYLKPGYSLKLDDKNLQELSSGEKGALLLVFYLLLDKSSKPLIIDQPEDNLDNQSVFNILVPFIKKAKNKRQIIMVTHNPNLAVVADAEQIIYVDIDKANDNKVSCVSGSIENPDINKKIVKILEGTMPAFEKRSMKYIN